MASSIDRRTFLRRGLALGTITTGAVVGGAIYESRGTRSPTTSSTSTTIGPATAAAWSRLGDSLTGQLIRPGNSRYDQARQLYNGKFTDLNPMGVAYCVSADDVARCVEFAAQHGLALTSRSGGHSYAGYSSCSGLVIDVSSMSQISVDLVSNTARVGAGATLIDVYDAIGNQGRLLPSGSCPSVGIAGLTLGGGIGVFGRRYGLTSDNLQEIRIVTADAQTLRADGNNHSDLLWASQGGGGGNFGVATSFEFKIHPMPEVTLFTRQYPWAAAHEVLAGWQDWISTTPNDLWSNCLLLSQGTAGYLAQISGVFCGTTAQLDGWLNSLASHVGTSSNYEFVGSRAYLDAMEIEAGCSGLSVAACHLTGHHPGGQLGRSTYSAKSSFVNSALSTSRVAAMVSAVEHLKSEAPYLGGGLAFDAFGGAINEVASDATAFVHRDKLAGIQATYSWSEHTSSDERAAGEKWLTWLGAQVLDPSTGAYQNYIDPSLLAWPEAYYGTNLSRLVRVKQKYDVDNLFSFAQSIPTTFP